MPKNNYFNSYRSGFLATHHVDDTLPVLFSGISRRAKQIYGNGLVGQIYTLVSGIGLYYEKYCELGGSTESLNGCIINGIQYGQIVGVDKSESGISSCHQLSQNYPNPFNPVTKIKFDVPLDSRLRGNDNVTLKIYDVLGKEIATLVNEGLSPGTYEVEWDGSNYPSGVYFYKLVVSGAEPLITADYSETRKMVLVK